MHLLNHGNLWFFLNDILFIENELTLAFNFPKMEPHAEIKIKFHRKIIQIKEFLKFVHCF